jgi:hypothetical protein
VASSASRRSDLAEPIAHAILLGLLGFIIQVALRGDDYVAALPDTVRVLWSGIIKLTKAVPCSRSGRAVRDHRVEERCGDAFCVVTGEMICSWQRSASTGLRRRARLIDQLPGAGTTRGAQ